MKESLGSPMGCLEELCECFVDVFAGARGTLRPEPKNGGTGKSGFGGCDWFCGGSASFVGVPPVL